MSQYIKTYGRIRPSTKGGPLALIAGDKTVKIETENGPKSYELHRIFNSDASQEEVFTCVSKKIVEDSAEGFNGTIFAYGQTGSGKTHTMLGPCNSWSDPERRGLIPRSIEYLFQLLDLKAQECQKFTFVVDVEFVELYNEDIFDLLNGKNKVQLRDSGKEIQLVGARAETVDNSLDLMHVVERGWRSRSTGSTAMNNESSRSHALLIIKIRTQEVTGGLVKERYSTLNLVDLAGSERQSQTRATGERLKEATNINSSLTVLGRCIRILSTPRENSFVPYRDSHLTHILKNSLGGNSKTAVIVNMHPDREYQAESTSTLMFAQSCTMIKNAVTRNEVMTGDQENSYKQAIQELRKEVDETRAKAREEFAKKLDEAEDIRLKLRAENDSLKADNNDLRAKYNSALVKYNTGAAADEIVNQFKKALSGNIKEVSGDTFQDLVSKHHTLKLECEASEKRCHELQQEMNDLCSRYQDNLNSTLQMKTPNAKERRSSSRPKRRETQYKPSPSRMAELAEDDDSDSKLQEAEIRIEKMYCEIKEMQSKLEEAYEKESKTQFEYEKCKNGFIREKQAYEQDLQDFCEENKELKSKVEKNSKTLESLLKMISDGEKKFSLLEKSNNEIICKHEKEMEASRMHYNLQVEDLQKKVAELQGINSTLQNKQQEIIERDLQERSTLITSLQKESDDKTEEIAALRKRFNTAEEDVKTKSNLITSLEQNVVKKAKMVSQLQEENAELLSEIEVLKQSVENLKRTAEMGAEEKKRMADMEQRLQSDFDGHQRDLKNLRAKKDQEISSLQKSLDAANEALKNQEYLQRKQRNESEEKFNKDVAEMEKRFKDAHITALKKQEEQIKRESLTQVESTLAIKENRIRELEEINGFYEKRHQEDTDTIANKLGTKQQKNSYLEKIRREKADAEAVVAQQRSEIARLSKGNRESNRPVLRSRNPQ